MKPLPFSLAVVGFAGVLTLGGFSPAIAPDDTVNATNSSDPATSGDSQTSAQSERREKMKKAFKQLDLTDAQKQQMAQIRQNVTDPKERRQQILAVLTPEQKAKLAEMVKAHQAAAQSNGASATPELRADPPPSPPASIVISEANCFDRDFEQFILSG